MVSDYNVAFVFAGNRSQMVKFSDKNFAPILATTVSRQKSTNADFISLSILFENSIYDVRLSL